MICQILIANYVTQIKVGTMVGSSSFFDFFFTVQ